MFRLSTQHVTPTAGAAAPRYGPEGDEGSSWRGRWTRQGWGAKQDLAHSPDETAVHPHWWDRRGAREEGERRCSPKSVGDMADPGGG